MPFNGAGTYALPAGNPVVTNTVISETVFNLTMNDLATALTNVVNRDGQTKFTGNLRMEGFELIFDDNVSRSSITADTDDKIDIKASSTDLLKITASTVEPHSAVSAYSLIGSGSQTVSGGVITVTDSLTSLLSEDGTADTLNTINGGNEGDILVLTLSLSSSASVTASDGGGNLRLVEDHAMDLFGDTLSMIKDGSEWHELQWRNNY